MVVFNLALQLLFFTYSLSTAHPHLLQLEHHNHRPFLFVQ